MLLQTGGRVYWLCQFDNRRGKLHIGTAISHSIKSSSEIEKAE